MTAIETQIHKQLPAFESYIEKLFSFSEGEWFCPDNKGSDQDYDYCLVLYEHHLLEKKTTPLWHNGSFKGNLIQFRYRKDLEYGK